MMELKVINTNGEASGTVNVSEAIFGCKYNEALIHQVVNAFLANARQGTRAQKSRSQVSKSTRKPFRQKGTGRARAGMASSPLWRGGGKIFPNMPNENFSQKVNRKMYRAALTSIFSELVRRERLVVTDNIELQSPKTKAFVEILNKIAITGRNMLVVVDELTEEIYLASRNLPKVLVLEVREIDPYNLLRFEKVLITSSAIEHLQEQLG